MTSLLAFHAFSRTNPEDVVAVLLKGPFPPPFPTGTSKCEELLGIQPPCVYSYLGRTKELFGDSAFAASTRILDSGFLSPFDTGGLLAKTPPVSDWPLDQKQAYLANYSWPGQDVDLVLDIYPGSSPSSLRAYLKPSPPGFAGPHAAWTAAPPPILADIWTQNVGDWMTWTWEGRWAGGFPPCDVLVAWSCAPTLLPGLLEWIESQDSYADQTSLQALMGKYLHGGVTPLVLALQAKQEVK